MNFVRTGAACNVSVIFCNCSVTNFTLRFQFNTVGFAFKTNVKGLVVFNFVVRGDIRFITSYVNFVGTGVTVYKSVIFCDGSVTDITFWLISHQQRFQQKYR